MEPNLSRSGTAARQQVWGAAKSRQWGAERGRRAGTLKAGCLNRVAIEQQLPELRQARHLFGTCSRSQSLRSSCCNWQGRCCQPLLMALPPSSSSVSCARPASCAGSWCNHGSCRSSTMRAPPAVKVLMGRRYQLGISFTSAAARERKQLTLQGQQRCCSGKSARCNGPERSCGSRGWLTIRQGLDNGSVRGRALGLAVEGPPLRWRRH